MLWYRESKINQCKSNVMKEIVWCIDHLLYDISEVESPNGNKKEPFIVSKQKPGFWENRTFKIKLILGLNKDYI